MSGVLTDAHSRLFSSGRKSSEILVPFRLFGTVSGGVATATNAESVDVSEDENEDEDEEGGVTEALHWRFTLCSATRNLLLLRNLASFFIRLHTSVTRPLHFVTSAVNVTDKSSIAASISDGEHRQSRASCSTVPPISPVCPLSCIAHKRSIQIPRVAGVHIETCGSFIQSPV